MVRLAVIFDWGGVLMRTEDYKPRHSWDLRLRLRAGSVERVVHHSGAWEQAQKGEITVPSYWEAVRTALNLTPAMLDDLHREFYSGDRLDENLLALIRDLRSRGILVGLLSNNTVDLLDTLLSTHLNDLFDDCVISAQIGIMKPEPGAYQAILDQLKIAAETALLIDDSIRNVEGAMAIGMAAIHFTPEINLKDHIETWLRTQGAGGIPGS